MTESGDPEEKRKIIRAMLDVSTRLANDPGTTGNKDGASNLFNEAMRLIGGKDLPPEETPMPWDQNPDYLFTKDPEFKNPDLKFFVSTIIGLPAPPEQPGIDGATMFTHDGQRILSLYTLDSEPTTLVDLEFPDASFSLIFRKNTELGAYQLDEAVFSIAKKNQPGIPHLQTISCEKDNIERIHLQMLLTTMRMLSQYLENERYAIAQTIAPKMAKAINDDLEAFRKKNEFMQKLNDLSKPGREIP